MMKKKTIQARYKSWFYLKFLVVIAGIGFALPARAQNITGFEYFFDTDPGFGLATPAAVSPAPHITDFDTTISISSLNEGFHKLFFRAVDDSGRWSLTQHVPFYKTVLETTIPDITGAEYFIDTDPGFGNGTAISVTPGTNLENVSFAADLSALSQGFHYLFTRVRDTAGRWSLSQMVPLYYVQADTSLPDIVQAEYILDTDPGFGNGIQVPVTPGTHLENIAFTVDISALSQGFHFLCFRVKDSNGRWSLSQMVPFFRVQSEDQPADLVKAEYFIDTDPGFGNGQDIPVTPGINLSDIAFEVDLSSLDDGFHIIAVRVKDAGGKWSLTNNRPFFKEVQALTLPSVTEVEYFFDTDPGFGNANEVTIVPGPNKTVTWVAGIAGLNPGFHQLFVRAKDSTGVWSLTANRPFYKETIPVTEPDIVAAEYFLDTDPGFGMGVDVPFVQDTTDLHLAFDIDIESMDPGFHKLFVRAKDSRGKWSQTHFQPFVKQVWYDTLPDIVQVEYFFDSDPGHGNGIQVPVNPAPQLPFLAWSLDLSGIAFGDHDLYVRVKDEYGKWSLYAKHDIFYYLDSLPTASLLGPPGICINGTAEFEVTLTGTPPWTLIYNTGESIDTVSGIMTSPHVFSVSPTNLQPHTAEVLQVQDIYYTGLYTGIPIEYQVYPLPSAAGPVYGPENVCQGTGAVWYWIYGTANTSSYSWSLPDGVNILSGGNSNSILVDFTNATEGGAVAVTPHNACGSGAGASLTVTVRPNPLVDAGPDLYLPFEGSDTLTPVVTGGTAPYGYNWSPWWYLSNPYVENPVTAPPSTVSYTLYVTDAYGCSGNDEVTVYVGLAPGTVLSGLFTYDNAVNTPMNNSTVMLRQGNDTLFSVPAGSTGEYTIGGIPAGWYTLSGTTGKPWGGVNATDALQVLRHFTEVINLTGLRVFAADVNATNNVNSIDALLIGRRYTEIITSFVTGDWLTDQKVIYASGSGSMEENLHALAYGDVNGSYIPEARQSSGVSIETGGHISLRTGETVELPLVATASFEVGAVSLSLSVPQGIKVLDVRLGKGFLPENLIFNTVNRNLRVAWFSANPATLHAGEPLLWIRVTASEPAGAWLAEDGSSLANGLAQPFEMVRLTMPSVKVHEDDFVLQGNYPNPFTDHTDISFYLPDPGRVKLSVFTVTGQEVAVLVNEILPEGQHLVQFDGKDLSPGMYTFTVSYERKHECIMRSGRMLLE